MALSRYPKINLGWCLLLDIGTNHLNRCRPGPASSHVLPATGYLVSISLISVPAFWIRPALASTSAPLCQLALISVQIPKIVDGGEGRRVVHGQRLLLPGRRSHEHLLRLAHLAMISVQISEIVNRERINVWSQFCCCAATQKRSCASRLACPVNR